CGRPPSSSCGPTSTGRRWPAGSGCSPAPAMPGCDTVRSVDSAWPAPRRAAALDADSRVASDALLATLAAERWRPGAWLGLFASASQRSAVQASARPQAAVQAMVLHLGFAVPARRRAWPTVSAAPTLTHLGML